MIRDPKRKALYEVIGKGGSKSGYSKHVELLHPTTQPAETPSDGPAMEKHGATRWPIRSHLMWLSKGRIEFSMSYQVAIAVMLGVVLALLVSFRLGQHMALRVAPAAGSPKPASGDAAAGTSRQNAGTEAASPVEQIATSGRNRIVIQMYQVRSHLEPVKEYFDGLGVATDILQEGNWYYLVTKNRFDNPDRPGTDGYTAKQRIIELGAKYKAPEGYETFMPRLFSDAFGKKFEQ